MKESYAHKANKIKNISEKNPKKFGNYFILNNKKIRLYKTLPHLIVIVKHLNNILTLKKATNSQKDFHKFIFAQFHVLTQKFKDATYPDITIQEKANALKICHIILFLLISGKGTGCSENLTIEIDHDISHFQ